MTVEKTETKPMTMPLSERNMIRLRRAQAHEQFKTLEAKRVSWDYVMGQVLDIYERVSATSQADTTRRQFTSGGVGQ